jgi:hypothetical protein
MSSSSRSSMGTSISLRVSDTMSQLARAIVSNSSTFPLRDANISSDILADAALQGSAMHSTTSVTSADKHDPSSPSEVSSLPDDNENIELDENEFGEEEDPNNAVVRLSSPAAMIHSLTVQDSGDEERADSQSVEDNYGQQEEDEAGEENENETAAEIEGAAEDEADSGDAAATPGSKKKKNDAPWWKDEFGIKRQFFCECRGADEPCQTPQAELEFCRKCVSDLFGRNKRCTRAIEQPITWSRSCYQKSDYHQEVWRAAGRSSLVLQQLNRIDDQEPGVLYTIVPIKGDCLRLKSIFDGNGDIPPVAADHKRGRPERTPKWAMEYIFAEFLGANLRKSDCERFIEWFRQWNNKGFLLTIPQVEMLPQFKEFIHQRDMGAANEQLWILQHREELTQAGQLNRVEPTVQELLDAGYEQYAQLPTKGKKPKKPKAAKGIDNAAQTSTDAPAPAKKATKAKTAPKAPKTVKNAEQTSCSKAAATEAVPTQAAPVTPVVNNSGWNAVNLPSTRTAEAEQARQAQRTQSRAANENNDSEELVHKSSKRPSSAPAPVVPPVHRPNSALDVLERVRHHTRNSMDALNDASRLSSSQRDLIESLHRTLVHFRDTVDDAIDDVTAAKSKVKSKDERGPRHTE